MKFLLLALALGITLPAFAQAPVRRAQVYRCGPDGRDLRDSPCPSGAATPSDADPAAGTDDKSARERHLADAKKAAAIAQARYAREAEARHQRNQAYGLQEQAASAPAAPRKAASSAGR